MKNKKHHKNNQNSPHLSHKTQSSTTQKNDVFRLNKKTLKIAFISLFSILLIGLILYFGIGYYIANQKINLANQYKIDVYNSMLCEFNCPLSDQEYQGEMMKLPELECVKTCSEEFRLKNYTITANDKEIILKDGLLDKISTIVNDCKTKGLNQESLKLDVEVFSNCSREMLIPLKDQYTYLK